MILSLHETIDLVCCGSEESDLKNIELRYKEAERRNVQEVFTKIRTIKILNIHEEMMNNFKDTLNQRLKKNNKLGFRFGLKNGFSLSITILIYGIGLYYCANVIATQTLDNCKSNCLSGGELLIAFFSFIVSAWSWSKLWWKIKNFCELRSSLSSNYIMLSKLSEYRAHAHVQSIQRIEPEFETGVLRNSINDTLKVNSQRMFSTKCKSELESTDPSLAVNNAKISRKMSIISNDDNINYNGDNSTIRASGNSRKLIGDTDSDTGSYDKIISYTSSNYQSNDRNVNSSTNVNMSEIDDKMIFHTRLPSLSTLATSTAPSISISVSSSVSASASVSPSIAYDCATALGSYSSCLSDSYKIFINENRYEDKDMIEIKTGNKNKNENENVKKHQRNTMNFPSKNSCGSIDCSTSLQDVSDNKCDHELFPQEQSSDWRLFDELGGRCENYPDTGTGTETETETWSGTGTGTGMWSETGTGSGMETWSGTGMEMGTRAGSFSGHTSHDITEELFLASLSMKNGSISRLSSKSLGRSEKINRGRRDQSWGRNVMSEKNESTVRQRDGTTSNFQMYKTQAYSAPNNTDSDYSTATNTPIEGRSRSNSDAPLYLPEEHRSRLSESGKGNNYSTKSSSSRSPRISTSSSQKTKIENLATFSLIDQGSLFCEDIQENKKSKDSNSSKEVKAERKNNRFKKRFKGYVATHALSFFCAILGASLVS